MRQLPDRIYLGELCNFSLDHAVVGCDYRGEGEPLMGFVLPPFQRPPVWTRNQSVRFLESLILGMPVGTYTYCSSFEYPKTDGWLIDGQQRMRAIQRYLLNELAVFGYKWSQLGSPDQRRVRNMAFPAYVLRDVSEQECLERYIKLNYSGTPHTEADKRRAKRAEKKMATNPARNQ